MADPSQKSQQNSTLSVESRTPRNQIIKEQTDAYLRRGVDDKEPADIERDILNAVNHGIETANNGFKGPDRYAKLKELTFSQIAAIIAARHHVCRIAPAGKNIDQDYDLLAIYQDDGEDEGVYATNEDTFRALARTFNYSLTTNDFKELMAALRDSSPRRHRCQDRDLIAVNNGIFNYATKQLTPFDPQHVFLSKSHVDYVPDPANPVIVNAQDGSTWDVESWMSSLSDDQQIVHLFWEICGAIIRPHVRWGKMAVLFSERGNNGKGTLCELMRELTGPTAHASIPIADFSKDFLLEPLTRASAVIVDENDVGTFVDRAGNLKAAITNDVISINRKHKPVIAYQFWGLIVQCLNDYPKIKDKSESFYRRQLFIPMEKSFAGYERKYIKNDYLHRQEVLQYVLWKVLTQLDDYYELSNPDRCKHALDDYKKENDPVRAFWDDLSEEFVWDLLPFGFLYDLYRSWFSRTLPSGSPLGRNKFIRGVIETVNNSSQWYCPSIETTSRPNGRMDDPEPLIAEYDLKTWMNPGYHSRKDIDKMCRPALAAKYRGLIRYNSGPVSIGDPDDINDTNTNEDVSTNAS